MSLIVFEIRPRRRKWDIVHNEVTLATFETREAAERSALAVAARHPPRASAEIDFTREDGSLSALRIF
jgi:hypothetical protein